MKRLSLAASALAIGLAGCGDYDSGDNVYDNAADYESSAATNGGDYAATGTASAGGDWPAGTRIVVDNGVTYRINPDGVRVALGPNDSRILVEDGVRYRVDPNGTRVRIGDDGAVIDVDGAGDGATVNVGGNASVNVNSQ